MKKYFVVLAPFDGIGAAREAIERIKPKDTTVIYYSCEIDADAMKIANANYPDIIQLGDVRLLEKNMIPYEVDLLIGGSPCQGFSPAGKQNGMMTSAGVQITSLNQYLKLKKMNTEFDGESYLFWEYVRLLNIFDPTFFVLENVTRIGIWKDIISAAVKTIPIKINSALVSSQNRDRFYWTNIPNVGIPDDRGIKASDIIPGARGYGERGNWIPKLRRCEGVRKSTREDGKFNCLLTGVTPTQQYILPNNEICKVTPEIGELMQTFPAGYTNVSGLSDAARHSALGNSFTVEVIAHILKHIPELK